MRLSVSRLQKFYLPILCLDRLTILVPFMQRKRVGELVTKGIARYLSLGSLTRSYYVYTKSIPHHRCISWQLIQQFDRTIRNDDSWKLPNTQHVRWKVYVLIRLVKRGWIDKARATTIYWLIDDKYRYRCSRRDTYTYEHTLCRLLPCIDDSRRVNHLALGWVLLGYECVCANTFVYVSELYAYLQSYSCASVFVWSIWAVVWFHLLSTTCGLNEAKPNHIHQGRCV